MIRMGIMHMEMRLDWSRSLKDKRKVLRSLREKLRNRYNVSIAESGYQDQWNHTLISLAQVALKKEMIYRTFRQIEEYIAGNFSLEILQVEREVK